MSFLVTFMTWDDPIFYRHSDLELLLAPDIQLWRRYIAAWYQ